MRRAVILCLGTLLLSACGDDGLSPQMAAVDLAEARWMSQGLVHYTVEARISCYCPTEMNQWHELTVASDSIIAIRPVDVTATDTASAAWFSSVEKVFERVRDWPSSMRGNRFVAEFDDETGMPLRVDFITSSQIADGGAVYEFRALKPGLFAAP